MTTHQASIDTTPTPTGSTPPPPPPAAPAQGDLSWVPPEYKDNPAKLAADFAELKAKASTPPPAAPTAVTKADLKPFVEEFNTSGKLSDAAYATLASKGFSKEVVDGYISGQVARNQARDNELFSTIGGKEKFDAIAKWAQSLPEAEVTALNNALNGDLVTAKAVLQGLAQRAGLTGGGAAFTGAPPDAIGGRPFASDNEMLEAMRDPRYKTSEAYRKQVLARMGKK